MEKTQPTSQALRRLEFEKTMKLKKEKNSNIVNFEVSQFAKKIESIENQIKNLWTEISSSKISKIKRSQIAKINESLVVHVYELEKLRKNLDSL